MKNNSIVILTFPDSTREAARFVDGRFHVPFEGHLLPSEAALVEVPTEADKALVDSFLAREDEERREGEQDSYEADRAWLFPEVYRERDFQDSLAGY